MPCIDRFLPEPHNTSVLSMLFVLGTGHSLAKLRIHTNSSLELLDDATTCLGITLWYFTWVICPEFAMKETAAKFSKRKRQEATSTTQASDSNTRKPRIFNMKTIKLHSLGDYVSNIQKYGTTDLYDTSIVSSPLSSLYQNHGKYNFNRCLQLELSHRCVKTRWKAYTSKKNTMWQLGNINFVESQVCWIAAEVDTAGILMKSVSSPSTEPINTYFHIAKDVKKPLILGEWLNDHLDDPALRVIISFTWRWYPLKVLTDYYSTSFPTSNNTSMHTCSSQTHHMIAIITETSLFKTASSINIQSCKPGLQHTTFSHPFDKWDALIYNPQEQGPYLWAFAQVLGIYHATIQTCLHPDPQTYYFLWVQ